MSRRRFVHAAAALAVAAAVVLLPATPAHADPAGLCSVKEWQDPSRFVDCANRLGTAADQQLACLHAPTPTTPDAGLAGVFTSRPDADLHSGVSGMYSHYGTAGYQVSVYDLSGGCVAGVTQPDAYGADAVANMQFAAASGIVSAANGLREGAYNPGGMWGWADRLITDVSGIAFRYVFITFGVLVLAGVGFLLLWQSRLGNLPDSAHTVGWAVLVLVVVTGLARYPLAVVHGVDRAATAGLTAMHDNLGPGPDSPTGPCPLPGPDSCTDHRTPAVRASDTVVGSVLYQNWLRAELGSADSPTARKYGLALFDSVTLSWAQAADAARDPKIRADIIAQKNETFTAIAAQIKTEDPQAYANLQGLHGTDRIGAGFLALVSAVAFGAFDILASLIILFGFAVLRMFVIAAPVVGTIGMARPTSSGLRTLTNLTVASLFNIVLFAAADGIYLSVITAVYNSGMSWALQLFAVALVGGAAGWMLRPVHRLSNALGLRRDDGTWRVPWRHRGGAPKPTQTQPAAAADVPPTVSAPPAAPTTVPAVPARPETAAVPPPPPRPAPMPVPVAAQPARSTP